VDPLPVGRRPLDGGDVRATESDQDRNEATVATRASLGRPRFLKGATPSTGFWLVAFAFFCLTAFTTIPSPLYGLYQQRDNLSPSVLTIVYASYGIGVVASLFLAGHLSDWYGRRIVLVPAVALCAVSAVILLASASLAGLLVARILNGVALGAAVATATAYILELDAAARPGRSSRRGIVVGTVANLGGLGFGALISGLIAQYGSDPLVVPYVVLLAALVLGTVGVLLSPETRQRAIAIPRYQPQRITVPPESRARYYAACAGILVNFAAFGLFAGLAGTVLSVSLRRESLALAGATVFMPFAVNIVVQLTAGSWPSKRLVTLGLVGITIGLAVMVVAIWLPSPSLALFLAGGAITGAGGGGVFRGTLTVVTEISHPEDRAGALAGFFLAGYIGLTLPVVCLGVALQHFSVRATLLAFAVFVGTGALAALPFLARPASQPQP
jgi:MFS family permease